MNTNDVTAAAATLTARQVLLVIAALVIIGGSSYLYTTSNDSDTGLQLEIQDVSCNLTAPDNPRVSLVVENTGDTAINPIAEVHVYRRSDGAHVLEFPQRQWEAYRFTDPGKQDTVTLATINGIQHEPLHEADTYRVETTFLSGFEDSSLCTPHNETSETTDTPSTNTNDTADTLFNITEITTDNTSTQQYNDSTSPTTKDNYTDDTWQPAPQTVRLTCTDDSAGCRGIQWAITHDGDVLRHGSTTGTTTLVTVGSNTDGNLVLQYRGIDNATNIEHWNTQTVRIDTETPTTAITAPAAETEQTDDFTVTVDDDDNLELAQCQYRINDTGNGDTGWTTRTCNTGFTVTVGNQSNCQTEGTNTCKVTTMAEDKAGNTRTDTATYNINYTTNTNETSDNETEDNKTVTNETTTETYTIATAQDWENGTFDAIRVLDGSLRLGYQDRADGLVGYWRLDGTSGAVLDYSGNDHDGTNNGAERGTTGIFDTSAFQFDGTDDAVDIGNYDALDFSGATAVTISAWVYWNGGDGLQAIINNEQEVLMQYNDGWKMKIYTAGQDTYAARADASEHVGDWVHLTGVYDGSYIRMYVNGEERDSTAVSDPIYDSPPTVAAIGADDDSEGRHFNGTIDELRVYDRALPAAEVRDLYFNGQPFTGTYEHHIDTSTENNWTTLEVSADIPTDTGVDATVEAVDSTGTAVDSQTLTLTDGTANHTLTVQKSEDARIQLTGESTHPEQTWQVEEMTVFYEQ